jgi:hypothetical protein
MSRFEKWSLLVSLGLAGLSGLGLLWTKYLLSNDDPWAAINHPLQPWFLKIHIVVTPLLVFALGLVAARHIWPHLRSARRGSSGRAITLLAAPLIVSGYLIQTVIEPRLLAALAIAHIALGVLFVAGFAAHQTRAVLLAERERARRPPVSPPATASVSTDRGNGGPCRSPKTAAKKLQ